MTRYSDELLESLRAVGDPEPDQLVEELAQTSEISSVNRILHELILNSQTIPVELPDNLENWLRATDKLPDGADLDRIERGAELFKEHGLTMSMILATASFLEAYAAWKGVKVMTTTYRLGQNAYKRVAETAQFLILVMTPGGLTTEEGQAIATIQKVRLMHSAIRYYIRKSGQWNAATYGEPICQEDMLGTLMCLSHVVIENLRKLNIDITSEQAEDFTYLWRIAGEMLGIRPDVIPNSFAEAAECTAGIRRHAQGPSEDGVIMTKALLELHRDLVPGERFDGLVPAVMRYLAGDQIADWLQVPRSPWDTIVRTGQGLAKFFDRFDDSMGPLADLVDQLGLQLVTRQAIALSGYERAPFSIPLSLKDAWHLETRSAANVQP
ncbi:MAG: oxygenase MpaB family protein [Anaerolineales bacterium]